MTLHDPSAATPPATPASPRRQRKRPATKPDTPAARQQHEREAGIGPAANPEVDPVMRQAHDDIASGQVDTDMHATAGLDDARRKRLVPGTR